MYHKLFLFISRNFLKRRIYKPIHSTPVSQPNDLYNKPYIRVLHLAEKLSVSPKKVLTILINKEIREYNLATRIFHSEIQMVTEELGIHQSIPSIITSKRPPIISVMGHVDHGKTTLLDSLRNTNVAENEPGMITQHVSSFVVNFEGRDVTIIDTPGHAAFAGIRGRGAKINDITVLVVDCCEGVQPQTREVIQLIHNYDLPCVVALNKIDKEEANIAKTEEEIRENGLELIKFNGNIPSIEISALKRYNLDRLMRILLLESDKISLEAETSGNAFGFVLETSKSRNLGGLATILPLRGTLSRGTIISSGRTFCKIKNIELPSGVGVKEITPGYPCTIAGWKKGLPNPGLRFISIGKVQDAKKMIKVPDKLWILEKNKSIRKKMKQKTLKEISVENSVPKVREIKGNSRTLCLILKSDTEGSKEAIETILTTTSPESLTIEIINSNIGDINISDVRHAQAINSHILGYNVGIHRDAKPLVLHYSIPVFTHNVVYRIIDYVSEQLDKMLPPDYLQERIGLAEIISTPSSLDYRVPLKCRVIEGTFNENLRFRVFTPNGDTKYDGQPKEFECKQTEIGKNTEFEVRFPYTSVYDLTDKVECYDLVLRKRRLFWEVNTE